jgi:RNA ligase (TIGR02306 family)
MHGLLIKNDPLILVDTTACYIIFVLQARSQIDMSTFACPVVRISSVEEHPNADRLNIIRFEGLGYTCISNKRDDGTPRYQPGDYAVYIPSASVLPRWLLEKMNFWDHAAGKGTLAGTTGDRVKPMRLRGVFSEGVIYPAACRDDNAHVIWAEDQQPLYVSMGDDASELLGITKWSPPIPAHMTGEVANLYGSTIRYDFERHENVMDMFPMGHPVVAMEKAHGTCCEIRWIPGLNHPDMFGAQGDVLVASKGRAAAGLAFKNNSENDRNIYVQTLRSLLAAGLEDRMRKLGTDLASSMQITLDQPLPVTIMMEIYGSGIQDLHYGTKCAQIGVFDVQVGEGWLPHGGQFAQACDLLQLPALPQLYAGPFDLVELEAVRDGVSAIGGDHIREGVVVRCAAETPHPNHGRRIMKMISPSYLTRRGKKNEELTEFN